MKKLITSLAILVTSSGMAFASPTVCTMDNGTKALNVQAEMVNNKLIINDLQIATLP